MEENECDQEDAGDEEERPVTKNEAKKATEVLSFLKCLNVRCPHAL